MRHHSLRVLFVSCCLGLTAGSGLLPINSVPSLAVEPKYPQYPLLDYKSYPPVNKVCTDLEVEKLIKQFIQDVSKFKEDKIRTSRLFTCGKSAVPALVKLLNSQDEKIIANTALLLQYIDLDVGSVDSALIPLLKHPSRDVRVRTVRALAMIGTKSKEAIPALILLLRDSEDGVNDAAATVLGRLGIEAEVAIPELVRAFKDKDKDLDFYTFDDRFDDRFALALSWIGDKGIFALIQLLKDPEPKIRYRVASALGRINLIDSDTKALSWIGDKGIFALIQLLKDPEPKIRYRAASALGRINLIDSDTKIVVSSLNKDLLDKDDDVCGRAAWSLTHFGNYAKEAMPNLIEVLRNRPSCNIDGGVDAALAEIGEDAVLPLSLLLQDRNRNVRLGSVRILQTLLQDRNRNVRLGSVPILRAIDPKVKATIPALIRMIEGQDIILASYAAETLGLIGSEAKAAIPALVNALGRTSIQDATIFALGQMGKDAVPDLISLISSSDKATKSTRIRALLTIGQIGAEAKEAIPHLRPLLNNQDDKIQLLTAIAIVEIGADADIVLPKLIAALQVENKEVRARVALAISNLGSSATQAVPDLLKNLGKCEKPQDCYLATQALIKMGKNAIPFLILALGDDSEFMSARSTFALTEIGTAAIPELVLALRNPNREVRRRAAFVLGQIGADAIPALQDVLLDGDTNARKGAIYALGIINKPSIIVINLLKETVEDKKKSLDERRIAASTLERMGQDTTFFKENNLVSPHNAKCPILIDDSYKAEFDIYTGKCLKTYIELWSIAGSGSLIEALCSFFGCK